MDYSEISESLVNEIIEENYHKQRRESAEMNALVLQRIELSDRVCGAAGMRRTVCGESN